MQTEPRRFGRALAELDLIISLLVSARLGTKAGNLLPNAVAPKPCGSFVISVLWLLGDLLFTQWRTGT